LDWLDNYTVVEACQDYTVTNNYNGTIPNSVQWWPNHGNLDGIRMAAERAVRPAAEIIVTPDTTPTDLSSTALRI
jgi:hypothetical protein